MTMTTTPEPLTPPETQYDARIVEVSGGRSLSIRELADQLATSDVVVIGEYHGHHGAHLLQSRLQNALYLHRQDQVLTMEQFNLDRQAELDRYLDGKTGETEMVEDAGAWDNYRASYRPLVEFARTHDTPVIAANAPAQIVRCVGRQGAGYLEKLDASVRSQLPSEPFMDTPRYRERFVEAIAGSHGTGDATMSERMNNTYLAQLLRDNTMASRILDARGTYPGYQVLHLTGTFHSESGLGTVALLKQRAPDLSVAVITPVFWGAGDSGAPLEDNREKGDYLYFIQPLPTEFRDQERAREAMKARFSRPQGESCD
ncbi:ChaN family lipoprotein [Marinobacter sediminum]|nr:ChaN family lipoprotein [Marinobacter sediminum]MCM0613420.1 ChaN family lipoprotein [Marinobacter sediminum]